MPSELKCRCGHRVEQHARDRGHCHQCPCFKFGFSQAQLDAAVEQERRETLGQMANALRELPRTRRLGVDYVSVDRALQAIAAAIRRSNHD